MDQNQNQTRETAVVELPFSKKKVKHYTYLLAKDLFGFRKCENTDQYVCETCIVDIDGDEKDIFEKVKNLRGKDYKVLEKIFLKMFKDETEETEEKKTSS
ncbi:MAG: hypothetical protein PHO56_02240 [Patescibacteria group bacterium]|nr:hypothetical protein [Patescibacteria group bacterium]